MSSAHSGLAIDAGAPGAVHDARGRAGVLLLILSEISFFSVFLVAYLFYIGRSLNGPYPADLLEFPVLGTVCLLSSSVTIMLATRALGSNAVGRFGAWLFVTFALGVSFLVLTALEWQHLMQNGLTIRTNLFGTTYYSLVGFHAAHVTLGAGIMGLLLVLTSRGAVTRVHSERVELFSWYWHFVDGVWVAVATVVYIIGV
jgi:cytochrome c oxidase subunit 3/cytochrome o ubiquinol oxidase subunit 3